MFFLASPSAKSVYILTWAQFFGRILLNSLSCLEPLVLGTLLDEFLILFLTRDEGNCWRILFLSRVMKRRPGRWSGIARTVRSSLASRVSTYLSTRSDMMAGCSHAAVDLVMREMFCFLQCLWTHTVTRLTSSLLQTRGRLLNAIH